MGLGIGGTEKTLVEAINAIDRTKYDITLYIRKARTILVNKINAGVHIIVNENAPTEENRLYSRICGFVAKISRPISKNIEHRFTRAQRKYVLKKRVEYEAKTFFSDSVIYDYAVAYDMAQECVRFVSKVVNAKKKIAFFHSSTLIPSKAELYKSFDTIVAVNSCVAKIIKNDYPALSPKVIYIENYLNPQFVFDELKKASSIKRPNSALVLCSCGRISPEKGFDLAVFSASLLKEKAIDFHWFFIGGGDGEKRIMELIKTHNLQNNITITGFVENPFGFMNCCDIYVQPSYEEAHATTMVESRILCKPIVSTDTASGRYFKEKYNCCIVTETQPQALTNGIVSLWNNQSLLCKIIDIEKHINYTSLEQEYINKINLLF